MLLEEHPEHRRLVARARREPSWDNVVRLAELSFYRCSLPAEPPWLTPLSHGRAERPAKRKRRG
jgi:hypothetical protein